jgi:hypothetical protein
MPMTLLDGTMTHHIAPVAKSAFVMLPVAVAPITNVPMIRVILSDVSNTRLPAASHSYIPAPITTPPIDQRSRRASRRMHHPAECFGLRQLRDPLTHDSPAM